MSKRSAASLTAEIDEKAKDMAITFRLKELQDIQRKVNNRPPKTIKCFLCKGEHYSTECNTIAKEDKMQLAKDLKLCLICVAPKKHNPAKCRLLRSYGGLCLNSKCGNNYDFHHASICDQPDRQQHRHDDNEPRSKMARREESPDAFDDCLSV